MADESRKIDRRGFLQAIALSASSVAAAAEHGEPVEPAVTAAPQTSTHPLDPLSSQEIERVSRLLRSTGKTDQNSLFSTITLSSHGIDQPPARTALAVVYQPENDSTHEHLVDLAAGSVIRSRPGSPTA